MILKKKTINILLHSCDGCSSAPLTQYKNNDIYRELIEEDKYFSDESDERVYIDMRRSKGYTDELEKINRDDSGIALNINHQQIHLLVC